MVDERVPSQEWVSLSELAAAAAGVMELLFACRYGRFHGKYCALMTNCFSTCVHGIVRKAGAWTSDGMRRTGILIKIMGGGNDVAVCNSAGLESMGTLKHYVDTYDGTCHKYRADARSRISPPGGSHGGGFPDGVPRSEDDDRRHGYERHPDGKPSPIRGGLWASPTSHHGIGSDV